MFGLPIWLWVVLAALVFAMLRARSLYRRFRGMCKGVRSELTELVRERHPEVAEVHEEQGNLIVTTADGERRVWEMADVYAAVARIPGMGADPAARRGIYEAALRQLFPNPASQRLADPSRIWPQLLRPQAATQLNPDVVRRRLPELGLTAVYLHGPLPGSHHVTTSEGLDPETLHQSALDSLRADFPRDLVDTPRGDSGSAIQLGDSLDAARLLLIPEHLGAGEEVIALVPHRDLLVLLPASAGDDPEKIREALLLLQCDGHPPLLERAVRITTAGFELV